MSCVVEHAGADDERDVERLLGVLSTLDASAGGHVSFVAPRGTARLVERALSAMARSDRHVDRARRYGAAA